MKSVESFVFMRSNNYWQIPFYGTISCSKGQSYISTQLNLKWWPSTVFFIGAYNITLKTKEIFFFFQKNDNIKFEFNKKNSSNMLWNNILCKTFKPFNMITVSKTVLIYSFKNRFYGHHLTYLSRNFPRHF